MIKTVCVGKSTIVVLQDSPSLPRGEVIQKLFSDGHKAVLFQQVVVRPYHRRSSRCAYKRDGQKTDISNFVYTKSVVILKKIKKVFPQLSLSSSSSEFGFFSAVCYGSVFPTLQNSVEYAFRGFSISRCNSELHESVVLDELERHSQGLAYLTFSPGGTFQDHHTYVFVNHTLVRRALEDIFDFTFVRMVKEGIWLFEYNQQVKQTSEFMTKLNIWKYRKRR